MKPTGKTPSEKIKRFFEEKDWKFYCAILGGIALVGGGYYITCSKEPKSPRKANSDIEINDYEPAQIATLTQEQRQKAAQSLKAKGNEQFGHKNFEAAAEFYSQALLFKPDPIFYSNRGACFANLGQNEKVIEDCNQALALDPMYVKALNRRGLALEKKEDYENALYDFTCICILDSFKNEAAGKSMERVLKIISEKKAKEMMKTKKQHLPSPTFVKAYLDSFHPLNHTLPTTTEGGDGYYAQAYQLIAKKDYVAACASCEKAVELGCSPAYQSYALNMMGTFNFLRGDTTTALEYLNKAIEANPNFVQNYVKRSSIFMERGDIMGALKQFDEAISINPSDPDIYYHRGQVNYISGNFDAAAKNYSKSIELDNEFVYAHIQLGVVQYKLGSISASMDTFNNTLLKFATNSDAHNYYGELLIDQQKITESITMFEKAITLDPNNPLPYINKAMIMYQTGNVDQSIQLCKGALQVDPYCDAAVASLAQILLEQNRPAEALEYYEMALDLARTEAELEQAISYVEATKTQIRFKEEYPAAMEKLKTLRT